MVRNSVWTIAATLSLVPGLAQAQTFAVQSITAGQAGTVAAAASGITTFQVYGTTTTISGGGAYVKGTVTSPTIVINCTGSCNGATARVQVTRTGVNTGRGQTFGDIGVAGVSPATVSGGTYNSTGVLDFTMTGWTAAGTQSFQLGMWLPVLGDDSSTSTTATSQFKVAVAKNPTAPSGGTNSTVTATVQKALSIAKTADLAFGTLVRPASGSGTVTINQTTGARTAAGGTPPVLVTSTTGRGIFTITGQSSSTYSLTVPTSFNMTSGANSIAVTVTPTQVSSGSLTLTGGTLTLGIGGSFTVTNSTPTGAYSGTLTVSLAYN